MKHDPDEEYESGARAGRAWAEDHGDVDQEGVTQIKALDLEKAGFEGALAMYMRCIDPEGNLAEDDILDGFEADGRMLTSDYLIGFFEGALEAIAESTPRPLN